MTREKKPNYLTFGDSRKFRKMLEEIDEQSDGRFLIRTLEKMFAYLLDIKNGDQLISAIVRTKEEDLIRITRE